jgi:hypothetical protein
LPLAFPTKIEKNNTHIRVALHIYEEISPSAFQGAVMHVCRFCLDHLPTSTYPLNRVVAVAAPPGSKCGKGLGFVG